MQYLNTSFIVPGGLAVIAFCCWILVVSRMTNLKLPICYRLAAVAWAMSILGIACYDMVRFHYYGTQQEAIVIVFFKTILRIGEAAIGIITYRFLGMVYPERMMLCPVEPTPKTAFTDSVAIEKIVQDRVVEAAVVLNEDAAATAKKIEESKTPNPPEPSCVL